MVLTKSVGNLKAGEKAIDFNLKGIDGKNYSLADFKDAKALLIIFMCNHCPYVKAKQQMIIDLQAKYKDKGLVIVGINSNESENYPEDSFDGMVQTAKEKNFNFVYLHDETQEVGKAYGASCTPDPFLFDAEQKLVYHGRLNNRVEPDAQPTEFDMYAAIQAVLEVKQPQHKWLLSLGCSINWKN